MHEYENKDDVNEAIPLSAFRCDTFVDKTIKKYR